MTKKFLKQKQDFFDSNGYVYFTDSEIDQLSDADIDEINEFFGGTALLGLPGRERSFFDWLRKADPDVWNDLWEDATDGYRVGLSYLRFFKQERNGFPICDLVETDNYWFCSRHLKPKANEHFATIQAKTARSEALSVEDKLLAEILNASIDIWHFCFYHDVDIDQAKQAVDTLYHADKIVHLPSRDDLLKYIDF